MMTNFDFYGRKAQLKKEAVDELDQFETIIAGHIPTEEELKDEEDHQVEPEVLKSLQRIVDSTKLVDNNLVTDYKELFSWHKLLISLNDIQEDNPQKQSSELVFQRVLNHPEIDSNG